jgi:hypothetical protein
MATVEEALRAYDARGATRARADRIFFAALALVCAVTILGGFTPTFYLRETLSPSAAPLRTTVVIHGAVFTTWVVLFVAQTALISARRRELHRRLGLAGVALVVAMLAIGIPLIAGFERGHGEEAPLTLAVHLLGNVAPLVSFAGFAGAGLAWRRQPDLHKRLMLFATLALQPAGFARLIGFVGISQDVNLPAYAVLCASVPIYDLCVDRRVRPVSLVGFATLVGLAYATDVLFDYIGS